MAELKSFQELEGVAIKEVEERLKRDHGPETQGTTVIEAGFEDDTFVVLGRTFRKKHTSWFESRGFVWAIILNAHNGAIIGIQFKPMRTASDELVEAAKEVRREARSGYIVRRPEVP